MDIKSIRLRIGLSQAEMAGILGIKRAAYSMAECGQRGLDLASFNTLKAFDTMSRSEEIVLPADVLEKLAAETNASELSLSLWVKQKSAELEKAVSDLKQMQEDHIASGKMISILADHLDMYSKVPFIIKRLAKQMIAEEKKFLASAPCHQRTLKIRIASLQAWIAEANS